ncbi:MAG: acylphosphatase [Balneolaceae bacterium]|nr:acylphosphatase [Balneolaceae bacterium]
MTKHVYISGRVQGVGFRYFTKKNARSIGIKGWVKNLPDGRVEAVFQGEEGAVERMLNKVRQGPKSSYVEFIDVEDKPDPLEGYSAFQVKY